MKANENEHLAEQLLDSKSERPKGRALKTQKMPGTEERKKTEVQRKVIQRALGK